MICLRLSLSFKCLKLSLTEIFLPVCFSRFFLASPAIFPPFIAIFFSLTPCASFSFAISVVRFFRTVGLHPLLTQKVIYFHSSSISFFLDFFSFLSCSFSISVTFLRGVSKFSGKVPPISFMAFRTVFPTSKCVVFALDFPFILSLLSLLSVWVILNKFAANSHYS